MHLTPLANFVEKNNNTSLLAICNSNVGKNQTLFHTSKRSTEFSCHLILSQFQFDAGVLILFHNNVLFRHHNIHTHAHLQQIPAVKRSNSFVKDHALLSCFFIDIISSSNDTTVWMAGISLLEMVAIEEQLAVLMVSFLDNLFASAAGNTIIADDPFSLLHKKFVEWILSSGTGLDK
jgi:hypothetical protein